jgi:hypothetical protein
MTQSGRVEMSGSPNSSGPNCDLHAHWRPLIDFDKKDLAKRKNCPARHQFSRRAVTAFSIELLRDSAATPLQSAELQVAQARRGRSLHIGCIARRAPGAIKTDNVSFWSARS